MARLQGNIIERIYKSILRFLGPLSLEDTYKRIVEEAVRLVNGEYGTLVFKKGEEFMKIYSSSPLGYESKIRKKAYTYKAYTENRAIIVNSAETIKAHPELKKANIRSTIFIPLNYKKKTIGVLIVNSKIEQDFGEKEKDILNLFGSIASLAIRKSQLNDENEKALATRDMFISMASHELKTPLTTINGYAQLLLSKVKFADPLTQSWVIELNNEIKRVTSLVKELLEVNIIKTGELNYNFEEANLKEILARSLKVIQFGYPQKHIVVENKLNGNQSIVCDADKLIEVFNNILENAAKYSPSESEIKIRLSEKHNHLRVVIEDKGIGIPKTEIERVFEGYFQAKNHNREGLGLGLYLSKNILDKHLGKLNIKSKVNKGTSVEILLPKHKES